MIESVYIASSSKFVKQIADLADWLEGEFNIRITRKWWDHYIKDSPDFKNFSDRDFYSHPQVQMIRDLDLKAVEDADLIIIYSENGYKLTGASVEYGYSLGFENKIRIFLGQVKRSAMYSKCIHIKTREELFNLIKRDR